MMSKPIDIFMVFLILLYTVLVFVYFGLDDILTDNYPNSTIYL
jgi:hypothetical protein